MKKSISIILLFLGILFSYAQAPQKMSYQAIIRNASGQLIQNQNVSVYVSILQGSPTGNLVYAETHNGTTNVNGLLTLQIGSGTVLVGNFSAINWSSGNFYLKTETDPSGGTNYTIAGTSQLLSVPYAMYANSAGSAAGSSQWYVSGNNIYNANSGNVGIGMTNPTERLVVSGKTKTTDFQMTNGAGAGKVLTSDASGNATWQTSSSGFSLPYSGSGNTSNVAFQVSNYYNNGNGGVGISGSSSGSNSIGVQGSSNTGTGVKGSSIFAGIGVSGTSDDGIGGYFSSLSGLALQTGTGGTEINGTLKITSGSPGNGKVLTSDANGNATWQENYSNTYLLIAKKSTNQIFQNSYYGTVQFDNNGGIFQNNKYYVPKNGYYHFDVNLKLVNNSGIASGSAWNDYVRITLLKNGTESIQDYILPGTGTNQVTLPTISFSANALLNENDYVEVQLTNISGVAITIDGSYGGYNSFSAYLLR